MQISRLSCSSLQRLLKSWNPSFELPPGLSPRYSSFLFLDPCTFPKNAEKRNAKSRHPGAAGDGAGARDPPVDRDQGVLLAGDSQLLYFQAWSSGYFFLLQFATKMKNEKKSKVDL